MEIKTIGLYFQWSGQLHIEAAGVPAPPTGPTRPDGSGNHASAVRNSPTDGGQTLRHCGGEVRVHRICGRSAALPRTNEPDLPTLPQLCGLS